MQTLLLSCCIEYTITLTYLIFKTSNHGYNDPLHYHNLYYIAGKTLNYKKRITNNICYHMYTWNTSSKITTCFHCIDLLKMNSIFWLTVPFMMTWDVKCFTRHSYAIEILFYMIRLQKWYFYWIMSICSQFWLQHYLICFREGKELFRQFLWVF